jgi:hypothetical protein
MREPSREKVLGGAWAIRAAITTVLATTVFAISLAGFGGSAVVATAAPDTGTYDDYLNLAQEACWGSVSLPVAWQVGDPESAGCAHSRSNTD